MGIIVQKYGGSSVADADGIKRVAQRIVRTHKGGHQVVVAVSAMGDSTDELIELAGQVHQLVGGITHRRHDHHDLVPRFAGRHDPLRDPLDPIRVSDRRTTVFLHDERHGCAAPPRTWMNA